MLKPRDNQGRKGEKAMPRIRAVHIEQLGELTEGRDRIGELIRRLIWSWRPKHVAALSFLSGEVNNFPGWDGWAHLKFDDGREHRSLWELSTQSSSIPKLKSDFKKSLARALPNGWTRETSTYVAVTTRTLKDRSRLRDDLLKTRKNTWSDIQIIDGHALEQWIERCPSVEQWIADVFGFGPVQFGDSLEAVWSRWTSVTQPRITPELVLAGREIASLKNALTFDGDSLVAIQSDSPEESVALLFSVINGLPEDRRNDLQANSLVVTKEDSGNAYAEQPLGPATTPLTILVPPATSLSNRFVGNGHRVVVALGRQDNHPRAIRVKRALRRDFQEALAKNLNLPEPSAISDARACGSSVSIWRIWNLLQTATIGSQIPLWAQELHKQQVTPAVLARSWDDAREGDREVLSKLAGFEYDVYRDSLQRFATCDDALYERSGTVLKLVAPSVAYALVSRSITKAMLIRLREAVQTVFEHVDKAVQDVWDVKEVELPQEESDTYSDWIRDGLAETLLAIAFLPTTPVSDLAEFGGGQAFVNALVRNLSGLRSDARVVASMNEQLPYLAEAAPEPFLEALESLIQGSSELRLLFADRGMFAPQFHVGVLWALEVLAWSPEYLVRTTRLLANLSSIEGRQSSGDAPLTSLKEIFLAWNPGTSASLAERLEALGHIATECPDTTWKLLMKLLPQTHDTASPTHEPSWRDFGRSDMKPATHPDVARAYRGYTELALECASKDVPRQLDLLQYLATFPPEYQERTIKLLRRSAESGADSLAWERLRAYIAKNRSFANTEWALRGAALDNLASIATLFQPALASERERWLFESPWPEIERDASDFNGRSELLQALRSSAIDVIFRQEGIAGITALISSVDYAYLVGDAFARSASECDLVLETMGKWIADSGEKGIHAARAASGVCFGKYGPRWTESLIGKSNTEQWAPRLVAEMLLDYPTTASTFDVVAQLPPAVQETYWKKCWVNSNLLDGDSASLVVDKLIQARRAPALIDLMGHQYAKFGASTVMRAIAALLTDGASDNEASSSPNLAYHISEAFAWLRKQPNVDRVELARLEYPFVTVLTSPGHSENDALVLHEALSSDPAFFVQVLSDVFKPRSDSHPRQSDKETRAKAKMGWHVLRSWRTVPGSKDNSKVEEDALSKWVNAARQMARDADRAEIGDQHIGKVLFHAGGKAPGATWLPEAVMRVFEKLRSQNLEQGFEVECTNSQGVTSRAPLSGGELEREEEQVWRERALALGQKWPRTRAMFNRIADNWKRHSQWSDESAEKLRMRWS